MNFDNLSRADLILLATSQSYQINGMAEMLDKYESEIDELEKELEEAQEAADGYVHELERENVAAQAIIQTQFMALKFAEKALSAK